MNWKITAVGNHVNSIINQSQSSNNLKRTYDVHGVSSVNIAILQKEPPECMDTIERVSITAQLFRSNGVRFTVVLRTKCLTW